MWSNVSDATTRLATKRLFAIYLFISASALAFPHRPAGWLVLALLHVIGIIALLDVAPFAELIARPGRKWPRGMRIVSDWYLLLLIPALYTELAVLNFSVFNGRYFDSVILGAEQWIFGGQPSRDLAHALPYLPLSEYFHLSYLSYYVIIYGPALYLYMKGRRETHHQLVFNLMLAFFAHYVFFIYFPVQGPRYLYAAPAGEISRGYFYRLAHRILQAASSRGAAFPSSHVGVSFAQTAFTFVNAPRLAPIILLLSCGLAVGAVYGGFHYATDALFGLLFGLVLFALAPKLARVLGRMTRAT